MDNREYKHLRQEDVIKDELKEKVQLEKKAERRQSWSVLRIILIVAAVLTPFIIPYVLVHLSGHSLFDVAPYYVGGDAVARYDYVRNILENGTLLGYNAYDFVTAKIPSLGSAWGFFWAIPYLVFGKIFGWGFNAPIIANIVFLCLANLLFILMTKADKKSILLIIIMNGLLYIDVSYSISAMSECSRYAIAIILAGMMVRLASMETSKVFKFVIVPLTILYGSATFILMSAYIIPYCLIILRKWTKWASVPLTLVIFGAGALGMKKLNSKFCTPYYEVFNMKKDIAALKEGIVPGLKMVLRTSLHNLKQFTLGAITNADYQDGKYTWFVVVCWLIMFVLAYLLMKQRYDTYKDKYLMIGMLYIMIIITAGYIVLYNDVIATLIRGINTALCAAVFLSTIMDSKRMAIFYIILALLWSPFFVKNFFHMCNEDYRCLTAEQVDEIQARRDVAAQYIKLSRDADPWDNTVAIRYGGKTTAFVVPSGAGKVSMHNVTLNEKARYVLVGTDAKKEDIQACIDEHLANGHKLLMQNDDFAILERTGDMQME